MFREGLPTERLEGSVRSRPLDNSGHPTRRWLTQRRKWPKGALDLPLYSVLETILHEEIHLWQQRFGEHPVKGNYHNQEFLDRCESLGLHCDRDGCHTRPADGLFEQLLKEYGITKPEAQPVSEGVNWWITLGTPKKGRSTLTKWQCPECSLNVRIGVKRVDIRLDCVDCHEKTGHEVLLVRQT